MDMLYGLPDGLSEEEEQAMWAAMNFRDRKRTGLHQESIRTLTGGDSGLPPLSPLSEAARDGVKFTFPVPKD